MIFNLGSMYGPVFAGAMIDAKGSYNTAYIIFAVSVAVGLLLLMIVKKGNFEKKEVE